MTLTKKQAALKQQCRQRLLTALSPGQLIVVVYKRSRTGFTQHQKWFIVEHAETEQGQCLIPITSNVAVVLGYASSEDAKLRAFNDGMRTDSSVRENAAYLAIKLYGEKVAHSQPFIIEAITV